MKATPLTKNTLLLVPENPLEEDFVRRMSEIGTQIHCPSGSLERVDGSRHYEAIIEFEESPETTK